MDFKANPGSKSFLDFLREGATETGDCGRPSNEKPSWLDKEKLSRVKEIYNEHCPGILFGHFMGQSLMCQVASLSSVLVYTGAHTTKEAATKRAVMTVGFVLGWYKGRVWDPNDHAHRSVSTVRAMHKEAFKKVSKDHPKGSEEGPWMSQYDMALTQFAFLGPLILYGDKVGLYCSQDEMECLVHFWRYVAYLLGLKDEYNIGGLPYDELVELCHEIVKEISIPTRSKPNQEFTAIVRTGTEGYTYLNRFLSYDFVHNFTCELLGTEEDSKTLDWPNYLRSWYFWLTLRVLRFQYLRQLLTPWYQVLLESKINRYFNQKAICSATEQAIQTGLSTQTGVCPMYES